jgi:general secretion pathway protein K
MRGRERGFALLIVLWTVGFLALLGTRIVAAGRSDTALADNLKQQAVLAAAADGAVSEVMFRLAAAHDPQFRADGLVRRVRVGATTVVVRITSENDRVNLNTASGVLMRALVIECGGAPAVAERIAAAVLDWRTSGSSARPGGAKAAEYAAAGRSYGPPSAPFRHVDELADVLGVTPELFARMAPHLTVLTEGDPDMSTHDAMVAQALTDAAGLADITEIAAPAGDEMFRIGVTAEGPAGARFSETVVASAEFQNAAPHVNILLRERGGAVTTSGMTVSVMD